MENLFGRVLRTALHGKALVFYNNNLNRKGLNVLEIKTKKTLFIEDKIGMGFIEFEVFGENQDHLVTLFQYGALILYKFSLEKMTQLRICSLNAKLQANLEEAYTLAVTKKGKYVVVNTVFNNQNLRLIVFERKKENYLMMKAFLDLGGTMEGSQRINSICLDEGYAGFLMINVLVEMTYQSSVLVFCYDIEGNKLFCVKGAKLDDCGGRECWKLVQNGDGFYTSGSNSVLICCKYFFNSAVGGGNSRKGSLTLG